MAVVVISSLLLRTKLHSSTSSRCSNCFTGIVHDANAMNPTQLAAYLRTLVTSNVQLSTMIWGAPGIGKSSIVAQVADESGLALVDLRLSQLAPTDLRGLPVPQALQDGTGIARWYPPEFLPRGGRGILFLDELNMAPPSMQGVAQQLILDRRVGSYQVPEGWFVWAAGNRKEDRASVFDMPAPLGNRFVHLDVAVDLESFKAYAIPQQVDERIIAFLSFRPDLLHRVDPGRPAWPSPRSWCMADRLMRAGLHADGALGHAAWGEFGAFLRLYEAIPDLDSILRTGGNAIDCPTDLSSKYATVIGLALRPRTGREAAHGFRWVRTKMSAEWTKVFMHDLLRSRLFKERQGELVAAVAAEPELRGWITELSELRELASR
jgi:hypothetical protein